MKAIFEAYGGLRFEVEGGGVSDIVKKVGEIIEAIGPEPCGKCKKENVFPNYREVDGTSFYELKCFECGAALQLGQHKDGGGLYKKKMVVDNRGKAVKDDNGKAIYLPNNGWLKWNPTTKKME